MAAKLPRVRLVRPVGHADSDGRYHEYPMTEDYPWLFAGVYDGRAVLVGKLGVAIPAVVYLRDIQFEERGEG